MPAESKYIRPVEEILLKQGYITTDQLTAITGNYKVNDSVIMVLSEAYPIFEEGHSRGRGNGNTYRLLTKEIMEAWENESYTPVCKNTGENK